MTRAEAVSAISDSCRYRFREMTQKILLDNMVPFLPLTQDELAEVAAIELSALQARLHTEFAQSWLGKLTWQAGVPLHLGMRCRAESACSHEGGRGIQSKVHHELSGAVESLVARCVSPPNASSESAQGSGVCADNVDIRTRVRAEGQDGAGGQEVEGLFIVLDSVYGSDEFEGY